MKQDSKQEGYKPPVYCGGCLKDWDEGFKNDGVHFLCEECRRPQEKGKCNDGVDMMFHLGDGRERCLQPQEECDCYKFENQLCDICQNVKGGGRDLEESRPGSADSFLHIFELCVTGGDKPEEAFLMAKKIMTFYLELKVREGNSLDQL